MKLKFAVLPVVSLLFAVGPVLAGLQVSLSLGSGAACQTACGPIYRPVVYAPCTPVVWWTPVQTWTTAPRFSNVSPVVTSEQGVVRVPPPVFTTQPLTVYEGQTFRWR